MSDSLMPVTSSLHKSSIPENFTQILPNVRRLFQAVLLASSVYGAVLVGWSARMATVQMSEQYFLPRAMVPALKSPGKECSTSPFACRASKQPTTQLGTEYNS